jgi:hypothetical protein
MYPRKISIKRNRNAKLQSAKKSNKQVKGQTLQRSSISVRTPAVTADCSHAQKTDFVIKLQ